MQMALGRRRLIVLAIVERPAHAAHAQRQSVPRSTASDAEAAFEREQIRQMLRREHHDRELSLLGTAGWWYGMRS